MSVVGFDIGNLNSYIGIARAGGIEVITNDYSLHATPSCVSFGAKERSMGVAARQAVNTNFKSTIINFKHLIGRKYSDPIAQKYIPFVPCNVVALPGDEIGFEVFYLDEKKIFTAEQVLAALLVKLKTTVESQVTDNKKVNDCVVGIPTYFTDVQRRAFVAAVQIAQLNPLRVINETSAIALTYGLYKTDLPEEKEKARHVVFLDVGHSATQAALVGFKKGQLTVINQAYDIEVGGLWFDALIREHFRQEFKSKYGIDAASSPRAWLRLLDESERVKKQMSANQTPIPLNIECFMEDKDVTGKMQRTEFEELAKPLFAKIQAVLTNLFAGVDIKPEEVDEIEIVGGSSRIPFIRNIINDIFKKNPKTTMNLDEAVARGAAMQCAILSPSFRVREFAIKDAQPFQIGIKWSGGGNEPGESLAFDQHDSFPFSKLVTLYRKDNFQIEALYVQPNAIPHTTPAIGKWEVQNVAAEDGEARKVKVKVRVNPNGIFSVASVTTYETKAVEPEAMETEAPAPVEGQEAAPPAEPKPTTKLVSVELPVKETVPVFVDVARLSAAELEMQAIDAKEKKKADAKNSLEEYVYTIRDKLSDEYEKFIKPQDAENFREELSKIMDWLYEEGEDVEMHEYVSRLEALQLIGIPLAERHREASTRVAAFDNFDQAINRVRKAYEDYVAGGEQYAHLDSKDMERVINAIDEKKKWLDESRGKQDRHPVTEPPVVFTKEINDQLSAFENIVAPILNKQKPAPPPQPKKEEAPKEAGDQQKPTEMEVD